MYADIEALVLSGELFNGPERSSSPTRSVSPDSIASDDPGWHDDELDPSAALPSQLEPTRESIGMGPGRTGVKGVIRDRDEAREMNRARRAVEIEELRKKMEKENLAGKTYLEEEREKLDDGNEKIDDIVLKERAKAQTTDVFGRPRPGRFGYLREIGVRGFVGAVEKEESGVWVVVHLYEASLDRCYSLDDILSNLARQYPDTKFLRCRAKAVGFAQTKTSSSTTRISRPGRPTRLLDDDDGDLFGDGDDDDSADSGSNGEDDDVDLDMLPTLLVYRNGELVHNWVRVDWEAGQRGIGEFLENNGILPKNQSIFSPDNEEDDDGELDFKWESD